MENFNSNDDFSFTNIKSVINYVIINYEKFILLLLVGIIIFDLEVYQISMCQNFTLKNMDWVLMGSLF